MYLSVKKIAARINGIVIGDSGRVVKGMNSFTDAGKDEIAFASEAKYLNHLESTRAGVLMVPEAFNCPGDDPSDIVFIRTKEPKRSFFKISPLFHPEKKWPSGIHHNVMIGKNVKIGIKPAIENNVTLGDNVSIGNRVHIMPGAYIGDNVRIDDDTIIRPNVTIMEKTSIGKKVLIHSGSVIGSDGYGFAQNGGQHEKFPHSGFVKIEDNVEIGACNTIDRGTIGTTVIRKGVKTDNLVHIAHNVKIGENSLIVAQVGIAGSTWIGKNVILAGKSGVSGHIKIGDNTIVGPCSGVHTNVAANKIVSGIPQMPHTRWRKVVAVISRLPELRQKIFSFDNRLKNLENIQSKNDSSNCDN